MKNKILSILCIVVLISFLFINNNVFAYTVSCDSADFYITDEAYEKLQTFDEYKNGDYYFMYHLYNNYYTVFIEKSQLNDIYFYLDSNNNIVSSKPVGTSTCYIVLDSNYSTYSKETLTNWTFKVKPHFTNDGAWMSMQNFNIYSDINKSSLFFQPTPVTLATVLEEVEMVEPIITTIAGLAKLLIPLLICLLGFWKAWGVFSRVLHNA